MATLAHAKYHGGTAGKPELTLDFIHECGYDSITVEAPEDILICYNDRRSCNELQAKLFFFMTDGSEMPWAE
jgi:hypothetical protein